MIIGSKVLFIKDAQSTNDTAIQIADKDKTPEGTIVHTNFQSAGRGQKGNSWESEDGKNLLFSVILYPEFIKPDDQFLISIFISLGICDFLKNFINGVTIKWPNDIYVKDDKIAGILIENSISGDIIERSVAGIGLNINQEGFSDWIQNPVSLKNLTGKDFDLDHCLRQLAESLDKRYKKLIAGTLDELREDYNSKLYRLGEWHNYETSNGLLSGKIISVTGSGSLQIIDKKGGKHEFLFGDLDFIL